MMVNIFIYTISVSLLITLASCDNSSEQKRLKLSIIRHQPCLTTPSGHEVIRFSPLSKAPLVPDEANGDGCYKISGPVQVNGTFKGDIQVYIQAKSAIHGPIEKCSGADEHGCGGVGSCVYCDICSTANAISQKTSATVRVEHDGKKLDCVNGLKNGTYQDITISFCLPTKEEFFKLENLDEDTWQAARTNGGGRMFFMTIFLFNKKASEWSDADLQANASDNGKYVIGCHRMVGTIFDPND